VRVACPTITARIAEPHGRLVAPLRRHREVVNVFQQLFVLLQGENDCDPVPLFVDDVILCTQLLRTSSPLHGMQGSSTFVRSAGWKMSSCGISTEGVSLSSSIREKNSGKGYYEGSSGRQASLLKCR
jgi:hypothetical protein